MWFSHGRNQGLEFKLSIVFVCVMQTIINIGHDYHDNVSVCCGTYCGRMELCACHVLTYTKLMTAHICNTEQYHSSDIAVRNICTPPWLWWCYVTWMRCHVPKSFAVECVQSVIMFFSGAKCAVQGFIRCAAAYTHWAHRTLDIEVHK